MAYVGPNDRALDAAVERSGWRRCTSPTCWPRAGSPTPAGGCALEPARFGPNYLTVYDVEGIDVMDAVALSGTAMPVVHEQGRLMACHSGGIRAALRPAGRWGAQGFRP